MEERGEGSTMNGKAKGESDKSRRKLTSSVALDAKGDGKLTKIVVQDLKRNRRA